MAARSRRRAGSLRWPAASTKDARPVHSEVFGASAEVVAGALLRALGAVTEVAEVKCVVTAWFDIGVRVAVFGRPEPASMGLICSRRLGAWYVWWVWVFFEGMVENEKEEDRKM